MNESQYDEMLTRLAAEPLLPVLANMEQSVWRKSRLRKAKQSAPGFWSWLIDPCVVPRFAVPGLTLALVVGFALGSGPNWRLNSGSFPRMPWICLLLRGTIVSSVGEIELC